MKSALKAILEALPVLNFEPSSTVKLHYRVGPAGMAGVLLQQDPREPRWLPIASHSRTFTAGELLLSRLELELRCVQEVLSKLRPITAFCSDLQVEATEELRHLLRLQSRLHPRLLARIIDVMQYRPTFNTSSA